MKLEIQTAVDWDSAFDSPCSSLSGTITRLPKHAQKDLRKLLENISNLVHDLSIAEVKCRRERVQTRTHIELLERINKNIYNLEKYITFAALL